MRNSPSGRNQKRVVENSSFDFDVAVVGGGSAGMAAAIAAKEKGASVVLIERESVLGGILNQCIHNGFGLSYFKEELTGPEYANRFIEKINKSGVKVLLNTTLLNVKKGYSLLLLSSDGLKEMRVKSIVLCMGCRERPAGAISLCGSRPAGIITAGSAQKIINIYGKMIGKNVLIVGSGDIGLIMARRLRFEGANVLGVYEILPYVSGLKRNVAQCLNDYDIPLFLSKTVVEVVGKDRVEGVFIAPVKEDFSFDLEKKEFVSCDTVVLSVGLIPENDIAEKLGVTKNPVTGGAQVDEYLQTNFEGIFSCGNVLHVHDIVDNVTKEAETAGKNSALFCKGELNSQKSHKIISKSGIRYTSPSTFYESSGILQINFRVKCIFENCKLKAFCGGKEILSKEKRIMLPAEMETLILSKKDLTDDVEIFVEE